MNDGATGAARAPLDSEALATPEAAPYTEADRSSSGLAWFSDLAQPPLSFLVLSLVGSALFLANLGGYPLYTKGEPREAVTIFNMLHGGGYILPLRAGIEVPSKPLLMHWLAAIISIVAGGVS